MSRNGAGVYTLPAGNPVVTGTTISSTVQNTTMSDVATALTQSIAVDGQSVITNNIPFANNKAINLAPGTQAGDALSYGQTGASIAGLTLTAALAMSGAPINEAHGADIASASTINLDTATGNYADVTGTTTITAITLTAGIRITRFTGILVLTNSSNLVNITGANITTAAGDYAIWAGYASSIVRMVGYSRASGLPLSSATIDDGINDFRLTLTTGVPVTTSNVTGATTIFCTPDRGNRISLYDGVSAWNLRTSAEISVALGTLTSGLPYDVFGYDNAGVFALRAPVAWTSGTARATALVYQDGVLVKSGATTDRYLGSFVTTSTTQTEDSASNRYLWNYYNRNARPMIRLESTASWNYTTATYRQANASTANQINFLVGVSEDAIDATATSIMLNGTTANVGMAIGLDSTTTPTGMWPNVTSGATLGTTMSAYYKGFPGIGKHFLAWLEISQAAGTTTWYGNGTVSGGAPAATQSGIQGSIYA